MTITERVSTSASTVDAAAVRRPPRQPATFWLGLLAWVIGILFIIPVLWMVLTSFHSESDAATNPPSVAAPLTLDGYREFFDSGPWPRWRTRSPPASSPPRWC